MFRELYYYIAIIINLTVFSLQIKFNCRYLWMGEIA